MKLAILTTQTPHHSWYISQLKSYVKDLISIVETTSLTPPFSTDHPFETERILYENNYFFDGEEKLISHISQTYETDNINDLNVLKILDSFAPNILITFGTRKIGNGLISKYNGNILNLHGGDTEHYRGLDSHLWAIYHKDWEALITTLHILNENLDDGALIQKCQLNLKKISELYQLRALNTEACVKLTLNALKSYEMFGGFITSKQRHIGKYYSFMPSDLKGVCVKNFKKYLSQNEH